MKKAICLLFAALILACGLTGCVQPEAEAEPVGEPAAEEEAAAGRFTADNEIITYRASEPEKTQLLISQTGNVGIESLCAEFEAQNPDVQLICIDITGGNAEYKPLTAWITKGYAPDIVMSTANFFDEELTSGYFENLSTNPATQNYEMEALKRTAVDDEIYSLPGPSNISVMMYNKTLFEKYGWQTPKTFDEFVSLCDQIKNDTNGEIEAWNPNAKYSNELLTAIEAFTYQELFGGAENRAWYNGYCEGKATFSEHMGPYVETLQTLIEHGILREEHFSYSATTRGKEFEAGKIAMINFAAYNADNAEFDFGYMPFPSTAGELGYLCGSYSCYIGVPAKEHTEAQRDAIQRFLEFFSSPNGQQIYIGDSVKVSNVRDASLNLEEADLAALKPAIDAGHMFELLDFHSKSGQASRVNLHKIATDMTTGERTAEECLAQADKNAAAPAEAAPQEAEPEAIAAAAQDMTVLETSFYIADAYREAVGADVGLIAHGLTYRGNVMRIFAGDITPGVVTVLKPRSFANESTLIKVSMTGAQLLQALNNPLGNEKTEDCIYAYSGLKCRIVPWNGLGGKYLSVKLADEKEIEPDKLYSVAFWDGTVAEQYITEILEAHEGSWEDIMAAKLKADGAIAPANDGRIELVWE